MRVFRVTTKIHTPVGIFTGIVSDDFETVENAFDERVKLQEVIYNCDTFTFNSDQDEGTEVTLNQLVVKNSVFEFTVIAVDLPD
jgi:hypothetical protein